MNLGLAGLVPAAELLTAVTGSREAAAAVAARIVTVGAKALPPVDDDLHRAARNALNIAGVVDDTGTADPGRAGELVAVCEVLAGVPIPPAIPAREARIVFSAPPEHVTLDADERLDGLVLDVIRCATDHLVIGRAFWNDAGFALLDEVIVPAVAVRRVPTTVYVPPS